MDETKGVHNVYTFIDQICSISIDEHHRLAQNNKYNLVITKRRVFGFCIEISYNKSQYDNAIEIIP